MPDVKVTYDKSVNAAYIYFTDPQVSVRSAHTYPCDPIDVDGMINLDFDEQGGRRLREHQPGHSTPTRSRARPNLRHGRTSIKRRVRAWPTRHRG